MQNDSADTWPSNVLTGWSVTSARTYWHPIPEDGVDAIVAALSELQGAGGSIVASLHPSMQKARIHQIDDHLQRVSAPSNGTLSGSPIYTVRAHAVGWPADAAISSALARFEPDQVHARWTAALDRRATDPAGAITLARTLIEDVCRWLLEELGLPAPDQDDLPGLYRKLAKAL